MASTILSIVRDGAYLWCCLFIEKLQCIRTCMHSISKLSIINIQNVLWMQFLPLSVTLILMSTMGICFLYKPLHCLLLGMLNDYWMLKCITRKHLLYLKRKLQMQKYTLITICCFKKNNKLWSTNWRAQLNGRHYLHTKPFTLPRSFYTISCYLYVLFSF